MLIGDHEYTPPAGPWTIDNWYVGGEIKPGTYLLLHEGHEIARGNDPYELLKIADSLNEREEKKEAA